MPKIERETGSNQWLVVTFKTPKTAFPPDTLINPSIVTLVIQSPDKTIETRVFGVDDIINPSTGVYKSLLELTQQNTYHWRWTGENGNERVVVTGELDSVLEPNF